MKTSGKTISRNSRDLSRPWAAPPVADRIHALLSMCATDAAIRRLKGPPRAMWSSNCADWNIGMSKAYNTVLLRATEAKMMANYAHPEVLVDTSWLKGNLGNENIRIVEVDYDPTSNYNLGHIPGSILVDWRKDINDPVARDVV